MSISKAEKYLGFQDRWLIIAGIPVISLLVSLMTFGNGFFVENSLPCFFIGMIFTSVYWIIFRQIIIEYHKRFPTYEWSGKRIVFVLFWSMLMYFAVNFTVGSLVHHFAPSFSNHVHNNLTFEFLTTGVILAMMFFLYEGIYYFNKSRQIEIEKNKLQRITAEQKLNTLMNQVNPHFLFNSLNTLTSLIPEDKDLAVDFVHNLSKSYRNILEVRDEKLITIRQELDALHSYIYLLKTRFQGKIQILNKVDEAVLNHFILPVSLQILIENAVKHNITSKSKPLLIEIFNQEDYIVVRNNIQKKAQQYNSTKLGLANIRSRYDILADEQISVEETEHHFIVKLPIITNLSYADSNN